MTSDPVIEVRGGVGGTAVGIDELLVAAGHLAQAASDLGGLVAGLVVAQAPVAASAPLSPVTALRAEVELVQAARSVALEAAAVAGVATAVRSTAWAYREVEAEVARTAALTQDVVMAVAGHGAPTLVVGVVVLDALGVDVVALVDRAAWEVPELADLAGGAGGLLVGLRSNPLTVPFVGPPEQGRGGSPRGPGPGERPPDSDEEAVKVLADSAAVWGLLRDTGEVRVTEVGRGPGSQAGGPGAARAAPAGVADLARDQASLPEDGRVRVVEVDSALGPAWIVEIGGTQVWDPEAGANPFDLTTDVRSMAAEGTLLAAGVQQALAAAQSDAAARSRIADGASAAGTVGTGSQGKRDVAAEPVMLAGHSLGGIVAAALASSADFRSTHRVTDVVALGSPIGKAPVPADVRVLAVEHEQDSVPRLEGRANPDRAGWVTVSRDLHGTPGVEERASAAHRSERYVDTAAAIDASDDPSLTVWRAATGSFFPGAQEASTAEVRDYRIERLVPPR